MYSKVYINLSMAVYNTVHLAIPLVDGYVYDIYTTLTLINILILLLLVLYDNSTAFEMQGQSSLGFYSILHRDPYPAPPPRKELLLGTRSAKSMSTDLDLVLDSMPERRPTLYI